MLGLDDTGNAEPKNTPAKEETFKVHVGNSTGERRKRGLYYEKMDPEDEFKELKGIFIVETEKPSVHVLEPVYENPYSYESVVTVLRNIGQKIQLSDNDGSRHWVVIVCDGVPYNLCHLIFALVHVCSICQESFDGKDACKQHQFERHPSAEVTFKKNLIGCYCSLEQST